MFRGSLSTEVNRDLNPDEEWLADLERHMMTLRHRILYQVKEYENETYGKLYGCYLSDPIGWTINKAGEVSVGWNNDYACVFYVAKVLIKAANEYQFRIVARYHPHSEKWWGLNIEPLGKLTQVRQFQAPGDSGDLLEYQTSSDKVEGSKTN